MSYQGCLGKSVGSTKKSGINTGQQWSEVHLASVQLGFCKRVFGAKSARSCEKCTFVKFGRCDVWMGSNGNAEVSGQCRKDRYLHQGTVWCNVTFVTAWRRAPRSHRNGRNVSDYESTPSEHVSHNLHKLTLSLLIIHQYSSYQTIFMILWRSLMAERFCQATWQQAHSPAEVLSAHLLPANSPPRCKNAKKHSMKFFEGLSAGSALV